MKKEIEKIRLSIRCGVYSERHHNIRMHRL